MPPELSPSDRPFPGAHPQVPGARINAAESTPRSAGAPLALEATAVAWERGWVVRIPVRAEHIVVDKQIMVYERVAVRRRELEERARLDATVQREKLSVQLEGDADVATEPH